MNKTYRLIWNSVKEAWDAVAETVRSKGCFPSMVVGSIAIMSAFLSGATPSHALDPGALPTGGQIVAGQGSISTTGSAMTVNQNSQRMIANWSTFNIGQNASVAFRQPNASAIALNRIQSQNPSQILGSLTANGKVWLVNPSGILFGSTARVDVGGLVASSLNMTNENFLAGRNIFEKSPTAGAVVNQGSIRTADGGYVAFMAPVVKNEGTITADNGAVVLAAADKVSLDFSGDSLITYTVDQGAVDALADNSGLIKADGGLVTMTAKAATDLTSAVVNNSGVIEARTLQNKAGRIMLISDMKNGETNVGGRLDASAPNGGDGGFIETSAAKVSVKDGVQITTSAPKGKTGEWLIDPNDFTIAASGGNITGAAVSAALAGSGVTIQTTAGGASCTGVAGCGTGTSGNGDIFVRDNISWTSGSKLTLSAYRSIEIGATIDASAGGGGSVALEYNKGGTGGSYRLALNGSNGFTGKIKLLEGNNFSINDGSNGLGTIPFYVITSLGAQGSATKHDLQGMLGDLTGNYALGADINAAATSGWNGGSGFTSIGGGSYQGGGSTFAGRFTGLGHTISNLTINVLAGTNNNGLFGKTSGAQIQSVGLTNVNITGQISVGALTGNAEASTAVSNSFVTGTVSGQGNVGGLSGRVSGSTISTSYSAASVTGAVYNTGGLVGGTINGSISQSYATGTVSGASSVGGLLGKHDGGTISDVYATGKVTATGSPGGLVGEYNAGTIRNAFATGVLALTGDTPGGLAGVSSPAMTMTNSYWNTTTTGAVSGSGSGTQSGTGLTTAEMMQQAKFSGLDFTNTWRIYNGNSYPLLKAFLTPLTITADNKSKTYNGSIYTGGYSATYSIAGATPSGALTYSGTSQAATNAGTYAITPGGLYSTNQQGYDITYVNGALTINPAVLTAITGNLTGTVTKVYDGTNTATLAPGNYQLTGWVSGDGASVTKTTGTYDNANAGSDKTVTVADLKNSDYLANGSTNLANYTLPTTITGVVGTITKAPLTVTASDASKTYGQTPTLSAFTSSGLKNNETIGSVTLASTGTAATANVSGSPYAITASTATGGTFNTGNYTITYNNGALTVTKAPLTVTANDDTKTYDGLAYKGVKQPLNAAEYVKLNQGGSDEAFVNSVYLDTLGRGPDLPGLLYWAKNLAAGATRESVFNSIVNSIEAKAYGGTGSGGNGVTYRGFVNNETSTVLGGTLTYGGSSKGAINAGSYAITPQDLTSGNYQITFADGTLTVNKAPLTVTANDATRYVNTNNPPLTGTITGYVNGESISNLSVAPQYTTMASINTLPGSYQIVASGAAAQNYSFNYVNGSLVISTPPPQENPIVVGEKVAQMVLRNIVTTNNTSMQESGANTAPPTETLLQSNVNVISSQSTIGIVDATIGVQNMFSLSLIESGLLNLGDSGHDNMPAITAMVIGSDGKLRPLPAWLKFDARTLTVSSTNLPKSVISVKLKIVVNSPNNAGGSQTKEVEINFKR